MNAVSQQITYIRNLLDSLERIEKTEDNDRPEWIASLIENEAKNLKNQIKNDKSK